MAREKDLIRMIMHTLSVNPSSCLLTTIEDCMDAINYDDACTVDDIAERVHARLHKAPKHDKEQQQLQQAQRIMDEKAECCHNLPIDVEHVWQPSISTCQTQKEEWSRTLHVLDMLNERLDC